MGSASIWFLSLVLCWGLPSPDTTLTYAAVYYVTPQVSLNPDCPTSELCLTINEYAQGNHFIGDVNITLLFLNGEHNLTAQNLEVANKTSLKIAPAHVQAQVVIHLLNGTHITVKEVDNLDFSGLNITTANNDPSACISNVNVFTLSINKLAIEYCQLSQQGAVKATITELVAKESIILSLFTQHDHDVVFKHCAFYHSTLHISDNLKEQWALAASDAVTTMHALSVENSSMFNSLINTSLQQHVGYVGLSILGTNITSQYLSRSETGIKLETFKNSTLCAFIKNCTIVGNHQGIIVKANESSLVELTIDQCYIAKNGHINAQYDFLGGIQVSCAHTAVTITSITSSTLSSNRFAQMQFLGWSGTTKVVVFNSTIRDTHNDSPTLTSPGYGAYFQVGNGLNKCMSINLTQNYIHDNDVGVVIFGKCTYKLDFVDNSVTRSTHVSEPAFHNIIGGYGLIVSGGNQNSTVKIVNCLFTQNQASAMLIQYTTVRITISETAISKNENGIIMGNEKTGVSMILRESTIQDNSGVCLGVKNIQTARAVLTNILSLLNVSFINNTNLSPNAGVIQVDGSISLSIENSCVFRANQGSVIHAFETTVTLSGVVTFEDNIAFRGGAISLSYSMLRLRSINDSNTNILLANNTATNTGGAIYVDRTVNIDSYSGSSCFYEIEGVNELKNHIVNVTLVMSDNNASYGGIDIYGATPNSQCPVTITAKGTTGKYSSYIIQALFFKTSSGLSSISSDPKRVCLCDSSSHLLCANLSYIFYYTTRYPGEVFLLSLAVVGFDFGTVTGPVYANLIPHGNNFNSFLRTDQHVRQITSNKCSQLDFTIKSNNSNEIITLTTDNIALTRAEDPLQVSSALDSFFHDHIIPLFLLTVPVHINVTLLNCSQGLQLNSDMTCECSTALKSIGINNCSIYDGTVYITRSNNQWVPSVANPDGILSSEYCPFNYCKHETVHLNLKHPDEQCALNHTGILCGACPSNLSLAIGNSRCLECSDNYRILLLIAFATAGVLLVLCIKILDMTVTNGTINGLVFYANIVWANHSILFPPQAQTSALLNFLKTFIAWLNLDFGIETCFIQNLNGYWKAWLQFAFPTYIWTIAGLIILVAHYSTRATKIFGNNSVSVLATLFLLAYAKLLRAILIVLEFTTLDSSDSQLRIVWSFDGNIPYFGVKHSIMFAVAVVILLVLWLPYTLVLLFIQYLRRHSHRSLLKWVNTLTPFFDAYVGPLKAKHHYWVGLGLLARLTILLTTAATIPLLSFVSTAVLLVMVSILGLLVLDVYKKWQLGALEGAFLVNLVLFSSGALVNEIEEWNKDIIACASVGITFILFVQITGYHVWKRCRSLRKLQMRNNNGYEHIEPLQQNPPPQQQEADCKLRESLLESQM